ncbi:MAG: RNA methyltransferase [Kordiimonadales bacterium]|nr:MAG: RNA methyltransferase [Kordiimonadales bacterium]
MAYDEELTAMFREALDGIMDVSEKRMMGGICFMMSGNMIGGADRTKDGERRFMFRVGKDNEAEALARPGATILEMGGKRLGGMVFVDEEYCDEAALADWVMLALSFVSTLPPKEPKKKKSAKKKKTA